MPVNSNNHIQKGAVLLGCKTGRYFRTITFVSLRVERYSDPSQKCTGSTMRLNFGPESKFVTPTCARVTRVETCRRHIDPISQEPGMCLSEAERGMSAVTADD
ncbi:unnamed protein product [Zymoseptoria tritici ST99CH_3D7]|uniref:Uncharacterized protein n=1 Tax=Zymoseptoria tritici (strain ST99CH_3D7) TaxID=1276538 RepID=A0A1X7RN95_ZYMT9|nr:unnamed protein product [Zymoseptoria tritici ST99CH_3D7]